VKALDGRIEIAGVEGRVAAADQVVFG
jgi:hypothetical protein